MNQSTESQRKAELSPIWTTFGVGLLVLLGAVLRLLGIADQLLVDDEWHGLYFVIGKSFCDVFTRFAVPGATCIPLNAYSWLLLHTVGWSELWLRLPSLAAGLVSLVMLPKLVRRLFGLRPLGFFTALLAISPFLIYYSRMCRPYSAVALLGPAALLAACLWFRDGRPRDGVLYILCGVGAVYFHLFAAPVVIAPLIAFVLPRRLGIRPARVQIVVAGLLLAALVGLLVGPALYESLHSTMPTLIGTDHVTWATATGSAVLWSGTSNPVLTVLMMALVVSGAVAIFRRELLAACVLAVSVFLYVVAFVASAPDGMHSPIVISRYFVPLFPLAYVLAAVGAGEAGDALVRLTRPTSPNLLRGELTVSLTAALFIAGPLIPLYTSGTSFTNHNAYQQSYRPLSWDESFTRDMTPPEFTTDITVSRAEVSPFCEALATNVDVRAIVEYPMLVGDHFNPHYYYQHFHHKRVIAGYVTDFPLRETPGAGRHVYGNTYIDEVLGLVPDQRQLKFRNLIDMDDTAKIRVSSADVVVIHKRFEAELPRVYGPTPALERLMARCKLEFGEPVYEDARLVAFRVHP